MHGIWLGEAVAKQIVNHARQADPAEACGLLAGSGLTVRRAYPVPNSAEDPTSQYDMEPKSLLESLKQIDRDRYVLMGTYHSHPAADALPSSRDVEQAKRHLPGKVHVIVGMNSGVPQLQAWRIDEDHRVRYVPLHIGDRQDFVQDSTLSRSHRLAIVAAAIAAVILLLVVSISLLPPAPVISTPTQ